MKKLRRKGLPTWGRRTPFSRPSIGPTTIGALRSRQRLADDFHWRPARCAFDRSFRLEEKRTVSNDWVVRYDNRLLQLERQSHRPPARARCVSMKRSMASWRFGIAIA